MLKKPEGKLAKIFRISAAEWAVGLGLMGLVGISLLMLRSVDLAEFPRQFMPANLMRTQGIYLGVSILVMIVVSQLRYQRIGDLTYFLFMVTIGLLLAVLVLGWLGTYIPILGKIVPNIKGSYRWIRLMGFQFQPSEFVKITYILALARYLRYRKNYRSFRGLLEPFAMTLVPMILILIEPDLGTVMLLLPVLFVMLYSAGAKIRHLGTVIFFMVVSFPLLFTLMADYQKGRIAGVVLQSEAARNALKSHSRLKQIIYPEKNVDRWYLEPEGYQLYQSKMAIASGGIFGFGLSKGPYIEGDRKLPECHNDFVFAIICHQFGLLGGISVMVFYLVMAVGLVEIAGGTVEPFGRLVVIGVLAMILVQAMTNMAMTIGLLPITGVTLPLVSYGGSSLLTYFILVGVVHSIHRERPIQVGPKPFEFNE
jgi:cell division protein FtsW (lipid II flippase)